MCSLCEVVSMEMNKSFNHNISKYTNNITTSHTGIYSIPSNDCDKYYIDET